MLAPRGEEAQTGTCPAKCGSSHRREWDKIWNSAKGACLLWQEFRSYHRAGGPIVWASLFATFLAMKKVEEKTNLTRCAANAVIILAWLLLAAPDIGFTIIPGLMPGAIDI